ncbi:uncharacterized protein LOC101847652 [Aplysia californica]|uniref:Uncharacterized protein LOC101847652 n=1 Tax=Aplysia californica TaxID=6500 RepID=A0ABM0JMW3_APLCA|nr:uncharacterized protein LOC101847652 [Aplysia californica]
MASKQSLQALQDCAQHQVDQARALQNAIRKLNSAKKENEVLQQQETLLQFVETLKKELQDFQSKAGTVHHELAVSLGSEEADGIDNEDGGQKGKGGQDGGEKKKRLPMPEDQETAYQLKARMMPQIYAQNTNLKAELVLMNRRNELRAQRKERQVNYNRESNLSAVTTLRAIQMYERKAKVAETRASDLQAELDELKGQRGNKPVRSSKSAEPPTSQSFLGPNNRVNDVIKKNEYLLEENQDQRHEIQRLKQDNAELIRKAKVAQQDRHQIMAQLSTSEMARKDLSTRLQKQKAQHDRLSRSLTRQSSDWIEARKQQNQSEEEWRWKNVGYAAAHGSHERTYAHHVQKNVDQPRYMYPVEKYAQSSAA